MNPHKSNDPLVTCPRCNKERRLSETPIREMATVFCSRSGKMTRRDRKQRKKILGKYSHIQPKHLLTPEQYINQILKGVRKEWWECNECLGEDFLVADTSKQTWCGMGGPTRFYKTRKEVCKDCGKIFFFTAAEQRNWYENHGIPVDAVAKSCKPCRQIRWAQKRLNQLVPGMETADADGLEEIAKYYDQIGSHEKARLTRKRAEKKREAGKS